MTQKIENLSRSQYNPLSISLPDVTGEFRVTREWGYAELAGVVYSAIITENSDG